MIINRESFVASPEIQQLVTMLAEKDDFAVDYRSSTREQMVCPVTVQFQYELTRHRAFSKDISTGGICLIGERDVEVEQIATLGIHRIDDVATKVRARCVWEKTVRRPVLPDWLEVSSQIASGPFHFGDLVIVNALTGSPPAAAPTLKGRLFQSTRP